MGSLLSCGFVRSSLERVCAVVFVVSLLVVGFFQGIEFVVWQLSLSFLKINITFLEALSSVAGFSLFISFCTLLSFGQIWWQSRSAEKSTDLSVAAVIPTYRDSHTLRTSVPSILELDYPDLNVVIACEEDDSEAIEVASELSEEFDGVEYVINDFTRGTKAGAINCAAESVDSDMVFVLDADQEVEKGLIRKTVDLVSNKGYDVVQARNIPRPQGFIETLCYAESLFVYVIPERLADFFTRYKVAASRGTAISRETLDEMDGFDPDFLTEDMDFAFRCYEQGKTVKPLLSTACTEKAPHSLKDYWGQRKRWIKGHIEVFLSRVKMFYTNRNIIYFKSMALSGLIPLGWFMLIILVSKFLILFMIGFDLFIALSLTNLILIASIYRFKDRNILKNYGLTNKLYLIGTPLIFILYGLVSIKALFEYILRGDHSWYRVEK